MAKVRGGGQVGNRDPSKGVPSKGVRKRKHESELALSGDRSRDAFGSITLSAGSQDLFSQQVGVSKILIHF
jgi:hypothetical protein